MGAGVVDRGHQLGHRWIGVAFGSRANDNRKYSNKRAEIWGEMRDWLPQADIPFEDIELKNDLETPQYGFNNREQIQLEKKSDMKKRGLNSPDKGDALALTFAERLGARYENDEDSLREKQYHRDADPVTGY